MSEERLAAIAADANMIVKGYAFTLREDKSIAVLNLLCPSSAMVISFDGEMLETNMDGIEQEIVMDCWKRNSQIMMETVNA